MIITHTVVRILSDTVNLNIPQGNLTNVTLTAALKFITQFAAAISLLVITIAGFRYVISRGNPDQITKSRNTIIYAIVGLVLSIMAYSIITFVVTKL